VRLAIVAPLVLGIVVCAVAPAEAASGYGFGGFSGDGARFLKHGPDDRACSVALPPVCQPIDRKAARDEGFTKPPRSRRLGDATVEVVVEDGTIIVRAGDTPIGRFKPEPRAVSANANVFVAPDGSEIAVEYEVQGRGADVVVFPVRAAAPAAPPLASAPSPSPPAGGASGNAYDRAVGKGGIWEQRMVPCDQAGVRLVLKKAKTFDLRVDTKCQAEKNITVLGGKWTTEGTDRLALVFENENAPDETMPCRFNVCDDEPGEDCLFCADAEVGFTLKVVRR
jgi:hypothetical protein